LALKQRNALLKTLGERGGNGDQLDVWDETLAGLGAQIIVWRIEAIFQVERLAARVHHELTRGNETLRLAYEPAYDPIKPEKQMGLKLDTVVDRSSLTTEEIRNGFLKKLRKVREEEIARGATTIGPHRDELRFIVNKADLGDYGSRGQIRTTLLALKLAEVDWMKERAGEWPVILLDEALAELDPLRRADLLKYVHKTEQAFFTTTDLNPFADDFTREAEIWDMREGAIRKR
jgi:DNA replication and repair protein RecF